MRSPGKSFVVVLVLVAGIGVLAAGGAPLACAADAPPQALTAPAPKRILILYDEDKDGLPGLAHVDRILREAFRSRLGDGIEITSESLALLRFERTGYDTLLADFYRRKYALSPPDLIVAVLEPSLDFLLRHADTLFHGVPIVFSGVDASTLQGKALPHNVTGVLVKRTFAGTLEDVLRLQPQTRHIFVVGGTSSFDRYLQGLVRRDLGPLESRVHITYLFEESMDALHKRLAKLPDRSAILYITIFTDGAGRRFVPHEVAASIAATANAPVYVFLDQYIGLGVVGGNVYSFDAHQRDVVELGARILGGASPASLPIREPDAQVDMFDARQLRRWKIDEARLPLRSVVQYREPSAWDQYRWQIAATMAVFLTQAALIAALLLARTRQRRAEAEARQERDNLAHVLRVTTLSELTSSLAHEISQPLASITLNADAAAIVLANGQADAIDLRDMIVDIRASADHASHVLDRVRALFRKELARRVAVEVGPLIEDVVRLLRAAMLIEHIDIRLRLGEGMPAVTGDAVQLEQVLLNVVRNACDAIGASDSGPRVITIETRRSGVDRVTIEVSDTGVGCAEGELERIFAQFVSTKPRGLGMGLAISRTIIMAHGGLIWATRNADRGLTIHIELIACEIPTRAPQPAKESERPAPSPPAASSPYSTP